MLAQHQFKTQAAPAVTTRVVDTNSPEYLRVELLCHKYLHPQDRNNLYTNLSALDDFDGNT